MVSSETARSFSNARRGLLEVSLRFDQYVSYVCMFSIFSSILAEAVEGVFSPPPLPVLTRTGVLVGVRLS